MQIKASKVFLTGASRGLGRALAEQLLERGVATLYAAAREPQTLEALRASAGGRVKALRLDITNEREIAAAAEQVGALDLLINNAGVLGSGNLLEGAIGAIESDMRTNYFGTLAVTRALLPAVERGRGAIANVLTVASLASMPGLGGYAASKAASLSLTQALRGELAKRGLQVHAVFPGPLDTDMARAIELEKTTAGDAARAILDAIERGEDDIFPDPMSARVGAEFARAPKSVEKMFAAW